MFTTKPELDRSGMGFSFMEAFMDRLEVISEPGKGTVGENEKDHWKRTETMDHTIALIRKISRGG